MSAGETGGAGGMGDTRGDSSVPKAGLGSCGDQSQAALSSTSLISEGLGGGRVLEFGWRGLYLGHEPSPG